MHKHIHPIYNPYILYTFDSKAYKLEFLDLKVASPQFFFGGREVKTKAFLCKIPGIKKMNCRKIDFIKARVIVGKIQTPVEETEESRRQCSFCVIPTNVRGGKNNNKEQRS